MKRQTSYKHEWVERWLNGYITIRNYAGAGRNHIEWIINAFKMGFYLSGALFFIGIDIRDISKSLMPIFSIAFLVFCFFLGWGWDKIKGYEVEAQWSNRRNPMQREIHEAVKKNESKRIL